MASARTAEVHLSPLSLSHFPCFSLFLLSSIQKSEVVQLFVIVHRCVYPCVTPDDQHRQTFNRGTRNECEVSTVCSLSARNGVSLDSREKVFYRQIIDGKQFLWNETVCINI